VHLKSLTLRGFKSFASSTTLRFEPGITAVVGPNGSGKSNIIDAVAWVLGEQGAKSLRGGKMEDVIFAGTAGRPPLGRAEVVLTIDNTDGALPIDYTEVTISRLMYRTGESEYAINGTACRLLDVQELLSDSGIGRELHVIIGQGQLDSVLQARPEDRRGFIEEAAGILKHRKRKEKALRKLEAMQANLARLTDLTAELRRQLKPLGRQAEVARRAAVIQAEWRDARLRLLADDVVTLRADLDREAADETLVRDRRMAVEAEYADVRARETELDTASQSDAPRLARAQETWYRLSSLRERLRGTASLAAERHRHLSAPLEAPTPGRDPEELEAEAERTRQEQAALAAQLEADRAALAAVSAERADAERALAAEEQRLRDAARAIADRREGLARLSGQVGALRSRAQAAEDEIGRLSAGLSEAQTRADRARTEFAALESQIAGLDAGEVDLDTQHERAVARLAAAESELTRLQDEERSAERDRIGLAARVEALQLSLERRDGAGLLLGSGDPGVLGTVAQVVQVRAGYEAAIAAALGAAGEAVAVASIEDALAALARLKAEEAGRVDLLVGGGPVAAETAAPPPAGAQWALDLVDVLPVLRPAVAVLLHAVAVVDDLSTARAVVDGHPQVRCVTRDGDLLAATRAAGGSAAGPSSIEVQAAADEAAEQLTAATHRVERLRFALSAAADARASAAAAVDTALHRLNESDARLTAISEQLAQLGSAARAAGAEAERLERARRAAEEARDRDVAGLAELEQRLTAAGAAPTDTEPDTAERDRLFVAVGRTRSAEMDARLAVRTGEERVRSLGDRASALARSAANERSARERYAVQRERRVREAAVAAAVAQGTQQVLAHLERSLAVASTERSEAERVRNTREGELLAIRARTRALAAELEQLTDAVHRDEVAKAEHRMRVEQIETKAVEDFGVPADVLVAEYGPDVPVPPASDAPEGTEPAAYERRVQEQRAATAERQLTLLGKVNPLALEEFSALEERHTFLQTQLDDLRDTRRDLMTVVHDVDERIEEVFTSAYHDVAREFEQVFGTLFPGGAGRLILTDPANMLTTGIEIEARPPGKKVKRLSLLSGGERSLTAVALLVAIFRARPSPFYILDEVEAALDDRNLGRLLELLAGLKGSSQLIIVTHQKRTMEIADALYGVSMRGDGVTTVIGQRLRDAQPDQETAAV
jgi:chromosome segregation protein